MTSTIKTIQTIARAYQQICSGEDPWIALGNFRNAWYGYAKDNRLALVSEPIAEPDLTLYIHVVGLPSAPPLSSFFAIAIMSLAQSGYISRVISSPHPGGQNTREVYPPA